MTDSLQLYFRLMGISIRGQMQYRGSFLMQSMGQFLITGIEFLGVLALFDRFGHIKGWTLPEAALMYGMANVAWAIADATARGFDVFGQMVKSGDFDRVLLRPRGTVLQIAGRELTARRIGRFLQGFLVLAWAIHALDLPPEPGRLLLVPAAVLGGVCLFYGLLILQATASFWTTESLEIFNILTYGGNAAAQYPLTIYRAWFRKFFTYVVPLACVNYLPAQVILGRAEGAAALAPWLSPLLGVAFLAICLRAWNVGVSHYTSTGS